MPSIRHRLFLLVLFTLVPGSLAAQEAAEEQAVLAVVQRLFDGMRAGDSTAVRAVHHPAARLISVGERDGAPVIEIEPLEGFIQAVGTPHEEVWDERMYDTEVRIDGRLATVWTKYDFFLGDTFSHCGVDTFQLYKDADGWKIFQIADTRRREGCAAAQGR